MAISTHKDRKYNIQEYDPAWKGSFGEEAEKIRKAFGDDVTEVEHVGSTSVPGMAGKSTIDLDVIVKDISKIADYEEKLDRLGYESLGEFVAKGAFFFAKEKDNTRIFNVHLMESSHPIFEGIIAVRDYLRSHPEEVKRYSDLKKELFKKYPNDYGSYRKNKDVYMDNLERRALGSDAKKDPDEEVRAKVAADGNLSVEQLKGLTRDKSVLVRCAVPVNENVTPEVLRLLIKDKAWETRWAVANSQNASVEILKMLLNDEVEPVRTSAQEHIDYLLKEE